MSDLNKNPFFSIVVPVYKVEKYLSQCVDSLINQDYKGEYEIILVDDGSPDRCPELCDEYAAKYEKIKVVHKPNGGLSDARNAGTKVAKGEYVTFVDSDDFWKDADVLTGVDKIIKDNNHPDVVVSDFYKYYEDSNKYVMPPFISDVKMNGEPKIEVLKYLFFSQADMKMSACQKFAFRELLTSIPFTKGLLSEDIDWSLKLYPIVSSICVYDKPYYCYRQNREGSITNTASQRSFDSLVQILDKWSAEIPKLNIPNEEKDIYMGYLAYQLSIVILLLGVSDPNKREHNLLAIKRHIGLFDYPVNFKTRKVKLLTKLVGIPLASKILRFYKKQR